MVPSEVYNPMNYDHLQKRAIKVALEQNIIASTESADKIFIGRKGELM